MTREYRDIGEIEAANAAAGHYFFSPDTMRFFKSRILEGVYGGRYFVTSERGPGMARRYTIREATSEGHIKTVKCGHTFADGADHEDFGCYRTAYAAKARARELAQVVAFS